MRGGQYRGVGELLLQVPPVRDHHDLEAPELGVGAHLADQEDHGQALPAALGVPDDAAAAVLLPILGSGLAGAHALHGELHGPELLVAADHLHGSSAGLHEHGEVAHDVEQVRRAQNAKDNRDTAGAVSRAEILVFTM